MISKNNIFIIDILFYSAQFASDIFILLYHKIYKSCFNHILDFSMDLIKLVKYWVLLNIELLELSNSSDGPRGVN